MPSPSRKPRRPKPGTGFLLVRLIGWCFKVVGGLLMIAGLFGFIAVLPKVISTIADAWQYLPEDKMAGFVVIGMLTWLLVFVLLGFSGIVLAGIGFALGRWGTEPATPSSHQSSTASTPAQPAGPG
jgi:ABC-type phosphate transport system permease subunit